MNFEETLQNIKTVDAAAAARARARWNSIAKPLYSLGVLEEDICRIAAIQSTSAVRIDKAGLIVMCADNGVVAEGVSQVGQEVTASVTENFVKHATSTAVMAPHAGVDIFPVDIGVNARLTAPGIIDRKIAMGTKNLAVEPAMTREQAIRAIEVGIEMVAELTGRGYNILLTGEMGIGNTTTSSAILAVLLDEPIEKLTGKGSGLRADGLERKKNAIARGIALHQPDPADPIDVLAKVGGLDIAGLVGVFLGGALYGVPVLVDGVISAAAALLAQRICPDAAGYMLASHCSKEPAGELALQALGLRPVVLADMCLGEGSGAMVFLPVLRLALAVYDEMSTFDETQIEDYNNLV